MSATTQTTTTTPPANEAAKPAGLMGSLTPIVLMFLAFYFLIMRPQQKREAKRRETINAVKRGDKVVTAGGVLGTVHKIVTEKEISLEISEGVRVRVLKSSVAEVLEKGSDLGKEETEVSDDVKQSAVKKTIAKKAPLKKKQ
ncbi:MAG: preprotein translocase subunit YajC [Holosporaceae bacterium]|jgi:preprotein translocase subunit YajC|nr:preprotein translocase subunit YajC [Holosporaceae bacterium]